MSSQALNPLQFFADLSGNPLDSGYLYIGVANENPQTNPITVYQDYALTIPMVQPLRTTQGLISLNGQPLPVYVSASTYSAMLTDKKGNVIWSQLSVTGTIDIGPLQTQINTVQTTANGILPALAAPTGASLSGFTAKPAGSIARTVADELNDGYANPKRFGAKGDDSADDSAAIQDAIDELAATGGGIVRFPLGNYRCNVTLKDGVTLMSGTQHFGYLAQSGGPISSVTLSQANPGFVVDTLTTMVRGVCAVKGINFQGLGASYAGGGVRFQNTHWASIKCCSANGFADQAYLHTSGFGVVFEDLLATNCLLNAGRTSVNGVLETHGTDDFINRCEIAGQSPNSVTDANLYRASIAVYGANNFLCQAIGEQGDRGIYIGPQAGEGHRMALCRADSNAGVGFWIDGNIISSVCTAYNNSLAGSGTYSGFYASATSSGCKFSACRSEGTNSAQQQKYGFEDYVNNSSASVRNSYLDCGGAYNASGLYLTQGFLGSGVIAAPQAIRPADATAIIDVTGTSLVVLAGYTTATNVTNFTGGAEGVTLRVLGDAQVTIVPGSGIVTPTGANVVLANNTMYTFTQYNGNWYMG